MNSWKTKSVEFKKNYVPSFIYDEARHGDILHAMLYTINEVTFAMKQKALIFALMGQTPPQYYEMNKNLTAFGAFIHIDYESLRDVFRYCVSREYFGKREDGGFCLTNKGKDELIRFESKSC